MSNYFIFNGISSSVYSCYIKYGGVHVPILAKTKDRLVEIPTRDGAYDFGSYLGALDIKLDCIILANSSADLNAFAEGLANLLLPSQGNKPLIVPDYTGYWLAHYTGTSDFKELTNYAEFTLPFVAPNPFRQGV